MGVYCYECKYKKKATEDDGLICMAHKSPPKQWVVKESINYYKFCANLNTEGKCKKFRKIGEEEPVSFFKRLFAKKKNVETNGNLSLTPPSKEGQLSLYDSGGGI